MIIVGERGSGLSSTIDHVLAQLRNSDARLVLQVSARLLAGGGGFLVGLAYECVSSAFDNQPPAAIEGLLNRLQDRFDHHLLVALLRRLRQERGVPLVVIDRFDALAMRLDPEAWASLRNIIEQKLLQILVLSRLSITEIETLSHSKLGQTIKQEILQPIRDDDSLRDLCQAHLEREETLPDGTIEYLGELGGGHRALTALLVRRVGESAEEQHREYARIDSKFVDLVVGVRREEVISSLEQIFLGLASNLEPTMRYDLDAEMVFAIGLELAPAHLVAVHSRYYLRLKRLGHWRESEGTETGGRFASALLRSRLLRRCLAPREQELSLPISLAPWLRFDELLRKTIRKRWQGDIDLLLTSAGEYFESVVSDWQRQVVWWGDHCGLDALDILLGDELTVLLDRVPDLVDSGWMANHRAALREVGEARCPLRRQPWSVWSQVDCRHVLEVLDQVCTDLASLLDADSPQPAPSKRRSGTSRKLCWLHISDAHFRAPGDRFYGEDIVRPAFLKTIKQMKSQPVGRRLGPFPDVVFFTGDIAFSGKSREYDGAKGFFEELLDLLDLKEDRLFLIPGNHDVDRDATKYLERGPQTAEETYEVFRDERWRRLYSERLRSYDTFCQELFSSVPERLERTESGFMVPQRLNIRNTTLVVHCLNAQWCGGLEDDILKLVLGTAVLHKVLDKDFRAARASATRPRGVPRDDLRIGLLHQPIEFLADFEQKSFWTLLGQHLDAILLGHLHDSEVSRAVTSREELAIFRTGALFGGMKQDRDNSAQIVECDVDERSFSVFPLRYEPKQDRWERDTSLANPPDYVFRGVLPSLPRTRDH
jgi:hypothetical protein